MKNRNKLRIFKISRKTRIYLITVLILVCLLLSQDKLKDVIADDNYSNYLFNQEITVDNDKAMILKDQSEGSNSYRNIFESNFLFPAKLQSNMFSTQITDTYSHYSFNQFYLDNLDNAYAYANSDSNENEYQDVSFENFNLEEGSLIQEGNTSNYGHYNATYSFENDNIGQAPLGFTFREVNNINTSVISNFNNHNNVVLIDDNSITDYGGLYNVFSLKQKGIIEFWCSTNITTSRALIYFMYSDTKFTLRFYSTGYIQASNNGSSINLQTYSLNTWYHFKIEFDCLNSYYDVYINNILKANNYNFTTPSSYINCFYLGSYTSGKSKIYLDGLDYNWSIGYYNNRNYYPDSDIIESEIESYTEFATVLVPTSDYYKGISYRHDEPPYTHYDALDDIGGTDNQYSFTHNSDDNDYDEFTLTNISSSLYFTKLEIYLRHRRYYPLTTSNDMGIMLYDGNSYLSKALMTTSGYDWETHVITYVNVNYSQSQINNFRVRTYASTYIPNDGSGCNFEAVWIKLYSKDTKLSLESEEDFTYNNENPIKFDVHYSIISNITTLMNLSIYNYDINDYVNFDVFQAYNNYNLYDFTLNESAFFRYNKIKVRVETNNTFDFKIYLDCLKLRITYVIQNEQGFQKLIIYNYRYDDTTLEGYNSFELEIYKDYLRYRYSEINLDEDDYVYTWTNYNISLIDLKNVEVQSHTRYGLNTLDIEIVNFYYIIYLNYDEDNIIEFREQQRKELIATNLKSSFNYTTYTANYLNLTGIVGNYSYNCLNGMRSLYGSNTEIFNRYFTIPFFSDDIKVSYPSQGQDIGESQPEEPPLPSAEYWVYWTFRVVNWKTEPIIIGNWTVDYDYVRAEQYQAKYFFKSKSIDEDDLGSWTWKIKFSDAFSYTVSFNFMRNAICTVINVILWFFQFVFFLVVASLSYILMFLGCSILVFILNTPLYYIVIAFIWVLWYAFEGLIFVLNAIWQGLVWVYENLLLPFFEWFFTDFIPLAIDVFIIVWAFLITCLIYCMTLGQIDFAETYDSVYNMLRAIADFIWENTIIIMENLPALFIAISLYLVLIGMTYVKYVYCKIRGYKERAEALYDSLMTYLLPITLTYQIIKKIYNSIPTAGGG